MRAVFLTRLPRYPGLYPNTLNFLRKQFEAGTTGDLVIPTLGTISAYAPSWTQEMDAKIRNGEKADFTFREDMAQDFLVTDLTNPAPLSTSMTSALAAAMAEQTLDPNAQTLLDSILAAGEAVIAVFDQAAMFGNLIEAKLLSLEQLMQQADRLDITQSAEGASIAAALHDLWAAERQMLNDLNNQQGGGLSTFLTPMTMSVQQISARLYNGDSSHGVDIMQLNSMQDPFAVPANSIIRYYPNA